MMMVPQIHHIYVWIWCDYSMAEKSTLLHIKFPLIRPSLAFILLQIDLIGLLEGCVA
jgi:hypothetical protein